MLRHCPDGQTSSPIDPVGDSRLLGMLLVAGVKGSAVLLTARRSPRKLLRKGIEQVEVAQPEPRSLEEVLADAEPTLRRFARRMCEDSGDVHDLLQDTFERACRHGVPQGIHCTRAWLTTIMQRLFLDRCRAASRRPRPQAFEDGLGVTSFEQAMPEPPWSRITMEDIREALDQIEPVYRDVYVLHAFDRLSYDDIARKLSIERITVGTRLSRARKQLREILVKRFGLEDEP
jgi:RNA polymerase sigma-70 factor (ECF subfamily)